MTFFSLGISLSDNQDGEKKDESDKDQLTEEEGDSSVQNDTE